jgi:hypothetical protein
MGTLKEIQGLSQTITPDERARLLIKDTHYRAFVDGKGFLNETEKNQLLRMYDPKAVKVYHRYCHVYEKSTVIMGVITEAYAKFKYYFETLRKSHLLLNFAPALEELKSIVSEGITDEEKKKEALEIIDIIDPLEKQGKKVFFKRPIENIKDNVKRAWEMASYFVSMKKVVDEITEFFGFSPFIGKNYQRVYENYIEEVKLSIKEHNDIMKRAGEELKLGKIEDYLIHEPTAKTDAYEEWEEALFGKESEE